jgi:hypothetical protein
MLKLNYDEISNVCQVCRRFRDNGNNTLNRQSCSLKNCVERLLAYLVKEENALLKKTSTPTYRLILIRCQGTLNGISCMSKLQTYLLVRRGTPTSRNMNLSDRKQKSGHGLQIEARHQGRLAD